MLILCVIQLRRCVECLEGGQKAQKYEQAAPWSSSGYYTTQAERLADVTLPYTRIDVRDGLLVFGRHTVPFYRDYLSMPHKVSCSSNYAKIPAPAKHLTQYVADATFPGSINLQEQ